MPTQQFKVEMNCGGCSKAVNAVLTKVPGVAKVDINMEGQLVSVEGTASQEELLNALKKTGKKHSVA